MARPPSGALWVHEIKHDGYRLMVRRDGLRVRCFTRNGHDWADRFPAIVRRQRTLGVQFHPEKSSAPGVRFIHRFLADAATTRAAR